MRHIIVAAVITFALLPYALAGDISGPEIIERVSAQMNQETCKGVMKLTIVTTSGDKREFTYNAYTADSGASNAIVYTSPVRVKGQAMLMLNNADDIWAYYPRTDRVRKLATHAKKQKMQGSDFTYEDMGAGNSFVTDFDTKRLEDEEISGHDCFKIVLDRKDDGDSWYARIVMWVIKENFVPAVIDYYDKDSPDIRSKRLTQSEIKVIDGIPTPTRMTMHNYLDESDTSLEIVECEYNVKIDDSRFTQRGFYR
jgi:outer membrane lipoprotein-sorting protein